MIPEMMLRVSKQKTYEGCLPTSLLILGGIEASKKNELAIIFKAVEKYRDSFYVYNILSAFAEEYNISANLYVENKFYSQYLNKLNSNKKISIKHKLINPKLFVKIGKPFALYVDDFILGEETHSQHFVVVEKIENSLATITDPWPGKRSEINIDILLNAMNSLKKTFLYSPLLITLNKYE